MSLSSFCFGVEIEAIVEPHTVRHPLKRAVYYEKLAQALRNRGLSAKADNLEGKYRKHAEHYDKWWITKDGSLGDPDHPGSESSCNSLNITHLDRCTGLVLTSCSSVRSCVSDL